MKFYMGKDLSSELNNIGTFEVGPIFPKL